MSRLIKELQDVRDRVTSDPPAVKGLAVFRVEVMLNQMTQGFAPPPPPPELTLGVSLSVTPPRPPPLWTVGSESL